MAAGHCRRVKHLFKAELDTTSSSNVIGSWLWVVCPNDDEQICHKVWKFYVLMWFCYFQSEGTAHGCTCAFKCF